MGWIKNTSLIALGGVIGYAIHSVVEQKAVRDAADNFVEALKKKFDDIVDDIAKEDKDKTDKTDNSDNKSEKETSDSSSDKDNKKNKK